MRANAIDAHLSADLILLPRKGLSIKSIRPHVCDSRLWFRFAGTTTGAMQRSVVATNPTAPQGDRVLKREMSQFLPLTS